MLAVTERGAPRDYVGLAALVEHRGFWNVYSAAAEKQPGLDPRSCSMPSHVVGFLGRSRADGHGHFWARDTVSLDTPLARARSV